MVITEEQKIKDKIEVIEEKKKQTAERRKILLRKHSKWYKSYYERSEFKEPVCFLMRRGKKVEWYEDVKAGEWVIEHTDGKPRTLFMDPIYIRSFDYGKQTFNGYIAHEDFPLPLPENPTLTAELTGIALEKTLNDIKKWKAEELRAQANFYKTIFYGVAILGVIYILYKMLIDKGNTQGVTQVVQVVNDSVKNAAQAAATATVIP